MQEISPNTINKALKNYLDIPRFIWKSLMSVSHLTERALFRASSLNFFEIKKIDNQNIHWVSLTFSKSILKVSKRLFEQRMLTRALASPLQNITSFLGSGGH